MEYSVGESFHIQWRPEQKSAWRSETDLLTPQNFVTGGRNVFDKVPLDSPSYRSGNSGLEFQNLRFKGPSPSFILAAPSKKNNFLGKTYGMKNFRLKGPNRNFLLAAPYILGVTGLLRYGMKDNIHSSQYLGFKVV
jgi:hypothetical protein